MKYLQDYKEESQSKLFEDCGAFFAFSREQVREGIKKVNATEKNRITFVAGGMYVLSKNVNKLLDGLDAIEKAAMAQDIEDNTLEGIILRELGNHEAWYTHDTDSTWDAVENYPGIKREYVEKLFRNKKFKIKSKKPR